MAERRRALGGLPALLGHLGAAFALAPLWRRTSDTARRRRLERRFFARALRAVGVEVAATGEPVGAGGTLFLGNHLSFTDVLALGTVIDPVFVAKADVAGWPLLGPLARGYGVLFVDRENPADARGQVQRIAEALRRGRDVVLFPEGTTSDGTQVLPFRSALLGAAAAARAVQPVAIRYSDGPRRAYIGDESFVANLIRLAPHRARVELHFLPPLPAGSDRKALAQAARAAIVAALARLDGVPPP